MAYAPSDDLTELFIHFVTWLANFGALDGRTANGLVRHSETYEIVAEVDAERVAELLNPDRVSLANLVDKTEPKSSS